MTPCYTISLFDLVIWVFSQSQQRFQQDWQAPLPGQQAGKANFKPPIVSALSSFGQENFLLYIQRIVRGVKWQ